MSRLKISCVSCGHAWAVSATFSLYEQQTVESCPCPDCGAYTLCCHDPDEIEGGMVGQLLGTTLPAR